MTKRTRAANALALPADSHTDRRTLLASAGAVAALIASTASPALAAPAAQAAPPVDPDAAVLALRDDFDRTLASWRETWPAHTAAEERYYELREAKPDHADDELRRDAGLVAAEAPFYAGQDENDAVVAAMVDQPARTLRGVIAKAEVSAAEDNMNPDLLASLVADLLAMKAAAA